MLKRILLAASFSVCLATSFAPSAGAADAVDIDAAKKEQSVVWYTSTPIDQANKIVSLFQDKYGVKVELFRSGGSEIMRRFMQEHDAGFNAADVLTTSDPEAIQDLAGKDTFVAFTPAGADQIPAELKDEKGRYFAQRLNVVAFYGNTGNVPSDKLPKSWPDLAKPEYKGKIVITDPSFGVLQVYVVGMLAKEYGWDYFEKLKANDIMIVKGGQQTFDMVKRSERPVSGGTDVSYATAARMQNLPIETVFPSDGAFVVAAPSAVVKGSPHPNAAKLLADFLVSKEAQQVFPDFGNYAARTDIAPPPFSPPLSEMKIKPIDYAYIKNATAEIKKKFNEIFQ
jgi:iron(III) transport system substrate-binding protein